jgi:hypothetical protein
MSTRQHPALPDEPVDTEAIRKAMALPLLSPAGAARIARHIQAASEETAAARKTDAA